MKKKALVLVMGLTMALAVVGCSGKKKETEAPATEAKTEAAAAEEVVSEAAAAAEEAVSEAAVEEAVSEAAEVVEEAVSEAAATAEEAVSEAAATAEEAVSEAPEVVEEAATEAAEVVADAEEEISEAAEEAAADVAAAAAGAAAAVEEAVDAEEEAAETEEVVVSDPEEEVVVSDPEEEVAETEEVVADAEEEVAETEEVVVSDPEEEVVADAEEELPARDKPYLAAVLVPGTLGDKSFWDSTNSGLTALRDELGTDMFDFEVQEMGAGSDDMASYPDFFLDAAESGKYDVIITGSWTAVDGMTQAMEEYPDQKFILFDEQYDYSKGGGENLYNLLFKQNEVSFLVGACAELLSETGTICFLGGMEGNVINDFLVGYIQGAKEVNADAKVAVSFVGNYEDSAKGKDLSLAMFNAGADVGFNVAGAAGMGILEAAKEDGKLAFGVDSDQAGLNPDLADFIPTSALKNVGEGLARAIKLDMQGKLPYGEAETLGFADNGVELLDDAHYQEMVPQEIRDQVAELQQKIADGEIEVLTSATMTSDEIEELKASVAVK